MPIENRPMIRCARCDTENPSEAQFCMRRATLGKVRAAQGRAEEAEELFRSSLGVLETKEYRFDLALSLLKYGEALQILVQPDRARPVLERARGQFAEMGATQFVNEIDARQEMVAP